MNSFHIVVAGNSEAALLCALASNKSYPDKSVALIIGTNRNDHISKLIKSGSFNNGDNGVTVIEDEIVTRNDNMIGLISGNEIAFEKLVIAAGSEAIKPHIVGVEKEGIYFMNKDPDYMFEIKTRALRADNIIVFGGGYIGVVLTDELLQAGKNVTLVARTNRLLPSSIDPEISEETRKILESNGGNIIFKSKVKEILGDRKISAVKLRNGEELQCDFLIICCGEKPNTNLADKFGLVYDNDRGILVDEYHRTSDKNIFAIGECAARFDFFCGDLSDFLLSATHMEEAKLIGSNIYSVIYNRGRLIDFVNEKKIRQDKIQDFLSTEKSVDKEQFIDSL